MSILATIKDHSGRIYRGIQALLVVSIAAIGLAAFGLTENASRATALAISATSTCLALLVLMYMRASVVQSLQSAAAAEAEKHRFLTVDAMTGAMTRRYFIEALRGRLGTLRNKREASLLLIDLDHFKQVNDRAGHAAGDAILHKVANVLSAGVRGGDTVARLGGDEFAVLLPGCSLDQALRIAEQIRAGVEREGLAPDHGGLGVTASIGVVQVDPGHLTLAEVLDAADKACYEAKHAGRNAVRHAPAKGKALAN